MEMFILNHTMQVLTTTKEDNNVELTSAEGGYDYILVKSDISSITSIREYLKEKAVNFFQNPGIVQYQLVMNLKLNTITQRVQ